MITHVDSRAAAAPADQPRSLFAQLGGNTSWRRFELLALRPSVAHEATAGGDEVGYLVLAGGMDVVQRPERITVQAPAAVRCAVATPHTLVATAAGARLLRIAVDAAGAVGGCLVTDAFAREKLPWRDAIHGGGGRIGTRHLWGPGDFVSSWTFVDHAVLSQGSSLGFHYHDHLEEAFVVLAGRGWMTVGDDTVEIDAGTVTLQRANVGHGLYNPFAEDLDFIRIAVATPGETFTTIDLDDDLRARRPSQEMT